MWQLLYAGVAGGIKNVPATVGEHPLVFRRLADLLGVPRSQLGHRIDSEEFYRLLEGQVIDDSRLFSDKLQEWENYYNFTGPTAPSAAKPPTSASDRRPKTHCHRPSSVAQTVCGAGGA